MSAGQSTLRRRRGFTLIELMVTIVVAGVLLALVIPSFSGFLSKRRVEGVANEMATDLQYARSEAVARNREVSVTFGNGCYVVYTAPATASTSTCAVSAAAAVVKSASIGTTSVSVAPQSSLHTITFEPVLGSASNNVNAAPGIVEIAATSGKPWKIQLRVSAQGRTKSCSPSGAGYVSGFSTDCSDS